jgi:hypothetical protein
VSKTKQQTEKTPGPWLVKSDCAITTEHEDYDELIVGPPGRAVDAAFFSDVPGRCEANAEYICAAVNACDELGLSVDSLRDGVLRELVNACEMAIVDAEHFLPPGNYRFIGALQSALAKVNGD